MKRSDALADLSREHHDALSLALRARRAAEEGPEHVAAMAATARERFALELRPHFEEEERWLLPALEQAGEHALVARTLAEHAQMIELIRQLECPGAETLLAFAECLKGHVRFEERELFQVAERYPECLAVMRRAALQRRTAGSSPGSPTSPNA